MKDVIRKVIAVILISASSHGALANDDTQPLQLSQLGAIYLPFEAILKPEQRVGDNVSKDQSSNEVAQISEDK